MCVELGHDAVDEPFVLRSSHCATHMTPRPCIQQAFVSRICIACRAICNANGLSYVSHVAQHATQMGDTKPMPQQLSKPNHHSFVSHIVPQATQMLVICVAHGTMCDANEWFLFFFQLFFCFLMSRNRWGNFAYIAKNYSNTSQSTNQQGSINKILFNLQIHILASQFAASTTHTSIVQKVLLVR